MTLSLLSFSFSAYSNTLPERIEQLLDLVYNETSTASYHIRALQSDFPAKLVSPASMLPQTAKYPLKDVQLLYSLNQTCMGKLPVSPLITEPLVFTRALCKGSHLPESWFARSSLIHPGGGTYAARYVDAQPLFHETLKHYMHVKERPRAPDDSVLGRLQSMTENEATALISGASMFTQGSDLWLKKGSRYFIYEESTWAPLLEQVSLQFENVASAGNCFVQRGNICWTSKDKTQVWRLALISLIAVNIVSLIGWMFYRWNEKRQEMQNRMLVLQILTHELRTPIASLSMTVEGFRREFEHLPPSVYDEFRRLCEDTRRLRQLAEASKDYLQSDNQPPVTDWVPSVVEWLDYLTESHNSSDITIELESDFAMKANIYWLGTCIDNLITNALKYGSAPVVLKVIKRQNDVWFLVEDQGTLSKKDWHHLKKPFVSKSGLGLGLTIVESMMDRMGGKMRLEGPPTTFILEIPCETDIATR